MFILLDDTEVNSISSSDVILAPGLNLLSMINPLVPNKNNGTLDEFDDVVGLVNKTFFSVVKLVLLKNPTLCPPYCKVTRSVKNPNPLAPLPMLNDVLVPFKLPEKFKLPVNVTFLLSDMKLFAKTAVFVGRPITSVTL